MARPRVTDDLPDAREPVFAPLGSPVLDDDPWFAFIAVSTLTEGAPPRQTPGQLDGVTFAVKNSIHAAGLATRAGSPAIDVTISSREAEIVRRLTAAGARCVGSLNMHELALGTTSANAYFGTVLNPAAPGRMAGGSSGGSAAAVAAGLVSFALATDTGGSARIPASFCGVAGLRPTTGRYPAEGIIMLCPSRDTAGVIANSIGQLALVDGIITGESGMAVPDPAALTLGVPASHLRRLAPEVRHAFDRATAELVRHGATLVALDPGLVHDAEAAMRVLAWEVPRALLALRGLEPRGDELTALELAEFADAIEEVASPDVRELLSSFLTEPVSASEYRAALDQQGRQRDDAVQLMTATGVDALAYPTVPITAPPLGASVAAVDDTEHALFPLSIGNTDPGAFAGLPSVTMPLPALPGRLPVGLGLEGFPHADRELLGIAAAIESVLTDSSHRI